MKIGGYYNWIGQTDRLVYLGKKRSWHQFKKIDDPLSVWCEVLDSDLHLFEETTEQAPKGPPNISRVVLA